LEKDWKRDEQVQNASKFPIFKEYDEIPEVPELPFTNYQHYMREFINWKNFKNYYVEKHGEEIMRYLFTFM
jgi:hypothetical protein